MVDVPALLCSRASLNERWMPGNIAEGRAAPQSHRLSQGHHVSLQTHGWLSAQSHRGNGTVLGVDGSR